MFGAQCHHDAENLVVGLVRCQIFRQRAGFHFRLEIEVPLCFPVAEFVQGNSLCHQNAFVDVGNELIQRSGDLTDVSGHIGHAALVIVQFFQRDHRQEDIMFLEAEKGSRIMHQDIGIQYKQFGFAGLACRTAQGGLQAGFDQFLAGRACRQFGGGKSPSLCCCPCFFRRRRFSGSSRSGYFAGSRFRRGCGDLFFSGNCICRQSCGCRFLFCDHIGGFGWHFR